MNPNPILVRNISHLTDARYFAAMGVDWLSIPLNHDKITFAFWKNMKEWVEGVGLVAEISAVDEMLLAKTLIDASPDGIILSQPTKYNVPKEVQLFYVIKISGVDRLPSDSFGIIPYMPAELATEEILQLPANNIFLQATWTLQMLEDILNTGYNGGICFTGEHEGKTGMRDYEMMDYLLDLLVR